MDDRLVWIEERICSSLKGNGDEVKSLFSNDQNRLALFSPVCINNLRVY